MKNGEKPVANPFVMLREEFDDWAILFNPDTCRGFGLNPIGVYLWKLFDGKHSVDDLLMALRRDAENVPENVHDSVGAFLEALVAEGLTGFQCTEPEPCAGARGRGWLENCSAPVSEQSEAKPFTYEPP